MFVLGPHWSGAGGTLNGTFWNLKKPGELCSSYVCLMVAAAALAKPKSELRAGGPGRSLSTRKRKRLSGQGTRAPLCPEPLGWGS